jgi:hypothetical protein
MLLSVMLVAGLTAGLQAPTHEGGVIMLRRLRGVDASIRASIEEGCRRSPVFAELVQDVERSNFVVYVDAVPTLRDGMKGALLHASGDPQYLRIHLKGDLPLDRQVAVLEHELQQCAGGGAGRHQRRPCRDGDAVPADRRETTVRRPAATVRNRGGAARGGPGGRRPPHEACVK